MNSCILMGKIAQEPQLRYTSDAQIPVTEMLVEFSNPGMNENTRLATIKVVAWRDLAQQVSDNYHQGDQVIIEGRLGMNTIDRAEGFKEKRAELTASRVYGIGSATLTETSISQTSKPNNPPASPNNVVSLESRRSATPISEPVNTPGNDDDPIPF
ncbi:MAG: single-stranded DNA-binding protein [Microcoleaceae cyanobacterium]